MPLAAHPAGPDSEPEASTLAQRISATQDPDQLYRLALSALAADQNELARQTLERVVAASPRFAGAWLDLAIATYRSGDPVAATEHLEYLRSQFTVPAALAAQIDYWQQLWQIPVTPPVAAPSGWQGQIRLGAGFDNNANAGLANEQIALSLPSGSTVFDVDSAYLPRASQFGLLGITASGPALAVGTGRLNPVILLRVKQLRQESNLSTIDFQPGLMYQQPAADDGSWQANLFAQHYRLGGEALFNGLRLSAQRSQPWRTCHWSGGAEFEIRQHKMVPNLGGTLVGLSAGLGCSVSGGASLNAMLKTGFERARFDRPGGNNRSTELMLLYDQPLSASQSLQATWQLSHTGDMEGYSPLMQDNAARQLRRQTLALGLRQAISAQWDARLSYEYFAQYSNLPLFQQHGQLVMLGLVHQFN